MKLTSKLILVAAFSTAAASSLFATPAMAASASEESSVADSALATESATEATWLYRETRPDGSIMGCPRPWLATGYGPVGQCTVIVGTFGRVGFYSPLTRNFSPTTGWLRVINRDSHDLFDGSGRIVGFGTLDTPYGPATFATKYRYFPDEKIAKGIWGSFNLYVRQFFPSNEWRPVVEER